MTEAYSPAFSRNDKGPVANWFWTVDRGLLAAALTLMGLGVALSFASSPAAILADQSITDPFHYSWRMMVFSCAGLVMQQRAAFQLDAFFTGFLRMHACAAQQPPNDARDGGQQQRFLASTGSRSFHGRHRGVHRTESGQSGR